MSPTSHRSPMPEDLRRFLLTSVPSIPFLEAMLLLKGEPATAWEARTVARRLYLSEPAAQGLLSELVAARIASEESAGEAERHRYRYAPHPDLGVILDAVAHRYAIDLVGVTSLIHSRLDKRAIQFADAFKWKKDN